MHNTCMYIFAGETANWTNLKWNFRDLCGRLPTGLEGRMPGGSGSYGAITVTVSSGKKEVGSVTWKLEELYVRVAWKCCCVNNVDLSYGFICFMPWLSYCELLSYRVVHSRANIGLLLSYPTIYNITRIRHNHHTNISQLQLHTTTIT